MKCNYTFVMIGKGEARQYRISSAEDYEPYRIDPACGIGNIGHYLSRPSAGLFAHRSDDGLRDSVLVVTYEDFDFTKLDDELIEEAVNALFNKFLFESCHPIGDMCGLMSILDEWKAISG